MKVLLINSYSGGSTGSIARDVYFRLKNGVAEQAAFAYGDGPDVPGGYRISSASEMKAHAYKTLLSGLHGYYSRKETKDLLRYTEKLHPDIIHFHNLHGGYLNLPVMFDYLRNTDSKVIFTLHDCWLYTGKCYHYYEAGCDKWQSGCRHCPQLKMYPKSILFDRTAKMYADKKRWMQSLKGRVSVTTVSDWLKGEAEKSFLAGFPIRCIHNGIDTELFRPGEDSEEVDRKYKTKGKFLILGVASSWNKHKGLNDFIALNSLLREDEQIMLVGITAEQQRALPGNFICIQRTDDIRQLISIYARANVFLSCSTEETFGLVTGEAMACGTPAVVCNTTACSEIVDNTSGIAVDPHNIRKIREAIDTVRHNAEAYGKNCRRRIQSAFSRDRMVDDYISLYQGVLGR